MAEHMDRVPREQAEKHRKAVRCPSILGIDSNADVKVMKTAAAFLYREGVKKPLGRMLILAITAIEDRKHPAIYTLDVIRDCLGSTIQRMPHDERVHLI
jgi:hypothetical protein